VNDYPGFSSHAFYNSICGRVATDLLGRFWGASIVPFHQVARFKDSGDLTRSLFQMADDDEFGDLYGDAIYDGDQAAEDEELLQPKAEPGKWALFCFLLDYWMSISSHFIHVTMCLGRACCKILACPQRLSFSPYLFHCCTLFSQPPSPIKPEQR